MLRHSTNAHSKHRACKKKIIFCVAEGEWKKRYYNHKNSFKNGRYENDTTLSKYIWKTRDILNEVR